MKYTRRLPLAPQIQLWLTIVRVYTLYLLTYTYLDIQTRKDVIIVGSILWDHSGPLCHALSLSSSLLLLSLWTSACGGSQWRMGPTFFKCFLSTKLYCVVTEARVSSLPESVTWKPIGRDSNRRPFKRDRPRSTR